MKKGTLNDPQNGYNKCSLEIAEGISKANRKQKLSYKEIGKFLMNI
jgi:hypothetical protein